MLYHSDGAAAPVARALAQTFRHGCILVYSGTRPASANHAASGALLARITPAGATNWTPGNGDGLEFLSSGRWLVKDPIQTWVIKAVAGGTATWWRLVGPAYDSGGATFDSPRIDGWVSTSAEPAVGLVLPSLTIPPGYQREVEQFQYTLT